METAFYIILAMILVPVGILVLAAEEWKQYRHEHGKESPVSKFVAGTAIAGIIALGIWICFAAA